MTRKAKKYLWDVAHSIEQIDEYVSQVPNLEAFIENDQVRDAVERRLTIIGEAIYRLKQMDIYLTQTNEVINRRNTIVHQYDDFSERSIWRHIREDLPDLLLEVKELLEAAEDQ